jgi:stage V sporulation protein SpoVS
MKLNMTPRIIADVSVHEVLRKTAIVVNDLSDTVQNKLRESVSVKDFGAVGDGVTDDTAAINNAVTAVGLTGSLLIPAGTYLYNGTSYVVGTTFKWENYGYSSGVNPVSAARNNSILLTGQTPNTSGSVDATLSKVLMSVTVKAQGSQHASGIRSNLFNYSTDGNGCTGIYAAATSSGTSTNWSAAVHGETRHAGGTSIGVSSESQSYEVAGSLLGVVANNATANGTTHSITGAPPTDCTNAYGVYVQGGNSSGTGIGGWLYGIHCAAGSMRANGISIYLAPVATVSAHFQTATASPASTADILLQGNSGLGIICNGTYKNGAIRISNDSYLSLNTGNSIGLKFDNTAATHRISLRNLTALTETAQAGGASTITLAAGASSTDNDPTYIGHVITTTGGTGSGQQRIISSYVGSTKVATVSSAWTVQPDATTTYSIRSGTERVGFEVSTTPGLFMSATKVVGVRNTGWTAMTGTSDKSTTYDTSTVTLAQLAGRVMAIQAALTTHGLLGA